MGVVVGGVGWDAGKKGRKWAWSGFQRIKSIDLPSGPERPRAFQAPVEALWRWETGAAKSKQACFCVALLAPT